MFQYASLKIWTLSCVTIRPLLYLTKLTIILWYHLTSSLWSNFHSCLKNLLLSLVCLNHTRSTHYKSLSFSPRCHWLTTETRSIVLYNVPYSGFIWFLEVSFNLFLSPSVSCKLQVSPKTLIRLSFKFLARIFYRENCVLQIASYQDAHRAHCPIFNDI